MQKLIKEKISTLLQCLDKTITICAISLFICFIIISFIQVIFRYVLRAPLAWSEELARYLFVWCTCLGIAMGSKKGVHISVDIIIKKFSDRYKTIIFFFSHSIIYLFLFVFILQGSQLALLNRYQVSAALGIPMFYPYLAVPICGILLLFYSIRSLLIKELQLDE